MQLTMAALQGYNTHALRSISFAISSRGVPRDTFLDTQTSCLCPQVTDCICLALHASECLHTPEVGSTSYSGMAWHGHAIKLWPEVHQLRSVAARVQL